MKKILAVVLLILFCLTLGGCEKEEEQSKLEESTIKQVQNVQAKAVGFEYDENALNYDLVWSDEFDYEGLPDSSKWDYDTGGGGFGNNELQYYTSDKNATVKDGKLTIEARKEDYQGKKYTSARMVTRQKGDWLYGKIEVKAKLPQGRGTWPAIWMLPTDWGYGDWPASGEIDIMEHVGYDQDNIVNSIHTKSYNHSIGTQKSASKHTSGVSEEFHIYSIEWLPDQIKFFIDGEMSYLYKPTNYKPEPTKDEWPFDKRFHLLINIACGGNWGGAQGVDDSIWPQTMEVDYVRIYQSKEINELTSQQHNPIASGFIKDEAITQATPEELKVYDNLTNIGGELNTAVEEKVASILSQMTLEEKIGQMTQADIEEIEKDDVTKYFLGSVLSGGGSTPTEKYGGDSKDSPDKWRAMVSEVQAEAKNTRLSIPLIYGIDAVHGNNNAYGATIYPHNIGLGAIAAGDIEKGKQIAYQIAAATASEVLNTGITWTFAPCLAVPKDMRWGRTYEGFSEDINIVSALGSEMVKGFQNENKVASTLKHYLGEGSTANGKNQGNAILTHEQILNEHLPPYIEAISAGAKTIMPSYSSINGVKMHGNEVLLNYILKEKLGFTGFIISDWDAVRQLPGNYKEQIKRAVNAGVDMVMATNGRSVWIDFIKNLTELVNEGQVSTERIDEAVTRILRVKAELGLLDNYSALTDAQAAESGLEDAFYSEEHRSLAKEAVSSSLVLLKNDNDIVSKLKDMQNIYVTGSGADDIGKQSGGWTISWQGSKGPITKGVTILEGFREAAPNINFTTSASEDIEAVIAVVGEEPYAEGQGDSETVSLSDEDKKTISDAKSLHKPIIIILLSGRPMDISEEITEADAFIAAWLPGSEGDGVAEVLFTERDFIGKTPYTWPWYITETPSAYTLPELTLFPKGYGLTKGETTSIPEKPLKPEPPKKPAFTISSDSPSLLYAVDFDSVSEGVQTEAANKSAGAGENVGYLDEGRYIDYNVKVEKAGTYKIKANIARQDNSTLVGGVSIIADGETVGTFDVPGTGDWQSWKDTVIENINLKQGEYTLRIKSNKSGWNLYSLEFTFQGIEK